MSLADLQGTFVLDPTHTTFSFVTRHAMVTKVRGSFEKFEGSAVVDAATASVDFVSGEEGLLMGGLYAIATLLDHNGLTLEDFDFIELGKMAIDYSDGVIEGESLSDRTLLDYANEKSKPTLAYPGDDFADAYKTFINEVCPDEE